MEDDYDEIEQLLIKGKRAAELDWACRELEKTGMTPIEAKKAALDSYRPHVKPSYGTPRKKKAPAKPKEPVTLPPQRAAGAIPERPKSANVLDDIKWAYEHYALPPVELARAMKSAPGGALSILSQLQDPENDTFKRTFWNSMVPKIIAHQKAVEEESKRGMRSAAILDMIDRILTEAEHAAHPSPPHPPGEPAFPGVPHPAGGQGPGSGPADLGGVQTGPDTIPGIHGLPVRAPGQEDAPVDSLRVPEPGIQPAH